MKSLGDDKGKFRQWNVKLVNALKQINPSYGRSIEQIMQNVDVAREALI